MQHIRAINDLPTVSRDIKDKYITEFKELNSYEDIQKNLAKESKSQLDNQLIDIGVKGLVFNDKDTEVYVDISNETNLNQVLEIYIKETKEVILREEIVAGGNLQSIKLNQLLNEGVYD